MCLPVPLHSFSEEHRSSVSGGAAFLFEIRGFRRLELGRGEEHHRRALRAGVQFIDSEPGALDKRWMDGEELKRRTLVRIFPNAAAWLRLVRALAEY